MEKLKDLCVAADNHILHSMTAAVGEDEEVVELWKEGRACMTPMDQNTSNNSDV